MHALSALLDAVVDYAGLFPPAKLEMLPTVRNYAAYRSSPQAWMLGRLVVPVSRFDEFELLADRYLPRGPLAPDAPVEDTPTPHEAHADANGAVSPAPGDGHVEPWRLTALVGSEVDAEIDRIFAFNQAHTVEEDVGRVIVDVIELKGPDARTIDHAMEIVPEQLEAYFEIPWETDPRGAIAALAGTGGRAKIRCGGPTADLFPPSEALARFMTACAAAAVPLKFTAGLHHPIRAEHRLTYEPDAPRGVMHGFLNVFTAALMLRARVLDPGQVVDLLEERDIKAFRFDDDAITWRGVRLETARAMQGRREFAASFGSCSFEEPVDDLRALGFELP